MRIVQQVYRNFYPIWKSSVATKFKKRRLNLVDKLSNNILSQPSPSKILEVGCNNGLDFLVHYEQHPMLELYGVDVDYYDYSNRRVNFLNIDAEKLPFEENCFDLTVSFGALEHIQPIEKLSRVIKEIDRVSKHYVIIVPSVGTVLEPHTVSLFWPIRAMNKKVRHPFLNFLSDEAWLQFEGFSQAQSTRFWYIPGVINNLVIWK